MVETQVIGRELDALVAERVMGLDRMTARIDPMSRNGEPQYYMGYPAGHDFAPAFSTNIAAAMEVENRIAELGLQSAYYEALVVEVANSIPTRLFHHFDVVHATSEQRCRAALAAIDSQKQAGGE